MIDKKPQCGGHQNQDDTEVLYGFFQDDTEVLYGFFDIV